MAAKSHTGMKRGRERMIVSGDWGTVWRTDDPENVIAYCPAHTRLPNGRMVACVLARNNRPDAPLPWNVEVLTSDDGGTAWTHRKNLPMVDCFPFVAGSTVYVLGGKDDLKISRSDDWGDTWTDLIPLETGRTWYSFPGAIVRSRGRIYMVRECRTEPYDGGFPVWILAPVVMSAAEEDDLTRPDAWTYSDVLGFQDVLERYGRPTLLGVPFREPGRYGEGHSRSMAKMGWGETNLVQIRDPDHIWYDPSGRTFHMFMRTNTGRSNLAALAKAVEAEDGSIAVDLETAPSGEPMLYVPFPGGSVGFIITWDEVSGLHWLVANQATDSMRRPDRLPPNWYGLAENERRHLALYFSRNCMDWCFAGLIAAADDAESSYYHGSTAIDGEDLSILMRVTDEHAVNTHNSNMIMSCRVPDFRNLAY